MPKCMSSLGKRARAAPLVAVLSAAWLLSAGSPTRAQEWKDSQIRDLKSLASGAVSNIDSVTGNLGPLGQLEDFVIRVQGYRASLDADALAFLKQAREEIRVSFAEQAAGLDTFLGQGDCDADSPCHRFKLSVVALFKELQMMTQTLLHLNPSASLDLTLNVETFAALIEAAPGKAIYPLYVALTSSSNLFESDLVEYFELVRESLDILRAGTVVDGGASGLTLVESVGVIPTEDLPDRCPVIMEVINPDRFQIAQRVVFGMAVFSKAVAKLLMARGLTYFDSDLGLHGYIGVTISNNRRQKIGLVIDGVSDSLFLIAAHANAMLRYCTLVDSEQRLLDAVLSTSFPGKGPSPRGDGP